VPDNAVAFTQEEQSILDDLCAKAGDDASHLQEALKAALPTLSASLIVKLRQSTSHSNAKAQNVANQLDKMLQDKLLQSRNILQELLNAGEIRKLDSLIGKHAKAGNLDASFFNVLTVNLRDAMSREQAEYRYSVMSIHAVRKKSKRLYHPAWPCSTSCSEQTKKPFEQTCINTI
jgi:hypothetical protein